jgi:hypothetical protein
MLVLIPAGALPECRTLTRSLPATAENAMLHVRPRRGWVLVGVFVHGAIRCHATAAEQ